MVSLRKCRVCALDAYSRSDLDLFRYSASMKYNRDNLCKECHKGTPEDKRIANKKRVELHRERKILFIEQKGGMCKSCGVIYTGKNACIFDFHHTDPTTKHNNPGNMLSGSLIKAQEEVDKCNLLCANCHRQEENEEW